MVATGSVDGRPFTWGSGRSLTTAPDAAALEVTDEAVVSTDDVVVPTPTSRVLVFSTLVTRSLTVVWASQTTVLVSFVASHTGSTRPATVPPISVSVSLT